MGSTASVPPGQGWASDCGGAGRAPPLGLSVPSGGGLGGNGWRVFSAAAPGQEARDVSLPRPEVLQLPVCSGNKALACQ